MQTIDNSQIHLPPAVLERLKKGETVVVEDKKHPLAYIVPAPPAKKSRPIGLCEGEFTIPDDFDDPLPEIEELIYGNGS